MTKLMEKDIFRRETGIPVKQLLLFLKYTNVFCLSTVMKESQN